MSELPLYDAPAMRELDRRTIEEIGIPGAVLMERAGLAAADAVSARLGAHQPVLVLCGGGGNGGDGFVAARHLHLRGAAVRALLVAERERVSGDARRYLEAAERVGVAVADDPDGEQARAALAGAGVVIDALLGTGFAGSPREPLAGLIAALNAARAAVVSLDVPSGVDASTGRVEGAAVEADLTVTFHARKIGLAVAPGRFHCGQVLLADIGIPVSPPGPCAVTLAGPDAVAAIPLKKPGGTKYSAGSVLVVGGSPGMTGAALMTGSAALRAGAGIVWLAVPEESAARLEGRLPELIVQGREQGLARAERAGAVALGPGLGREQEELELARRLGAGHTGPIVIDADGLFAFAGELERLAARRLPAVLTPHEGEMARLLGVGADEVRAERLRCVREAACRAGAVVLLKGADTLVAAPGGGRVVVCASDVAGLATAGSGDVLTGIVAAALAKGVEPLAATVAAAVAHAEAGRLATERLGPAGIIAGDVIDALPAVFRP